MAQDPSETNNLATQYPEKAAELARALNKIEGQNINSSETESPIDWAGSD